MTTPERWARITGIFGQALELEGPERDEFVERTCADDLELLHEIQRLLRTHDQQDVFLDHPPVPPGILEEASSARTFRSGQLVSGRFRIIQFLGEGGMGEVYATMDEELRTSVALKTTHAHLAGTPKFAERLRQEIQLARRVTHPNVCRVFDAGRHEATPYFTMELLNGETLSRRIERTGAMPLEDVLPIVRQMCAGLSAAHEVGILHRDFKTANVMFSDARAVITDFGLARVVEREDSPATTTAIGIGTPAYMAPEQFEGSSVTPAVDIYALGVVMYELVTGRRPFEDHSPLAIALKKLKQAPSPRQFSPELPAFWEAVILKCLEANPADRFASASEVITALENKRSPSRVWRLPKFFVHAVAVVLIAVAGVAFILVPRSPHKPPAEASRWYEQGVDAMADGAFLKASNLFEKAISLDDSFVQAHARLAETYAEMDQIDKAKDEVIHASMLVPDRSKLPPLDALLLDAAQATVAREFDKAQQAYRAIAEGAPEAAKSRAWIDFGRAAEKAGKTADAANAYRRVPQTSPRIEAAMLHLGTLSAREGDSQAAALRFNEALQRFHLLSNFEGETESRLALARLLEGPDLAEAENQARAAIDSSRLTGNVQQQVKARFQLGRIQLLQGHEDDAKTVIDEAVAMAGQKHLDNLSVQGLNDLSAFFSRKLMWKQVEENSQRAIELAKRSKSRAGEAVALFYLGQARTERNDNDGAVKYLNQAAAFYRQGNYLSQLRAVLSLESAVFCNQGRYQEAKNNAAELQKWADTHPDPQTLILALQAAAEPLVFEGDYVAALDLYQRETEVEKRTGRQAGTAYGFINQADLLWRLGRYEQADARLNDAHSILGKLGKGGSGPAGRAQTVKAEILLSQLRFIEAGKMAAEALVSAADGHPLRVLAAQIVLGLARVHSGQVDSGLKILNKALRTAEEGGHPAGISAAKVAVAEAALVAKEGSAARLADEARAHCLRYGHKELALRALLLQSVTAKLAGLAAVELEREFLGLEKVWGNGTIAFYSKRPDIHWLINKKK